MKSAYYIMMIKSGETTKITTQPESGYKTMKDAELGLINFIEKLGDVIPSWRQFTIMKLYRK